MGLHSFVYSHQEYGRGSYDWDIYKCTNCTKSIMVSEDHNGNFDYYKETCEEYREKNPVSYHQEYEYY